ncbi:hypothetical protein C8Q79DRAFT_1004601 [Trametes meyenii]|nr:hypothetical protein C8Q79DRAFT_1004601 [Trametes meyenii]
MYIGVVKTGWIHKEAFVTAFEPFSATLLVLVVECFHLEQMPRPQLLLAQCTHGSGAARTLDRDHAQDVLVRLPVLTGEERAAALSELHIEAHGCDKDSADMDTLIAHASNVAAISTLVKGQSIYIDTNVGDDPPSITS